MSEKFKVEAKFKVGQLLTLRSAVEPFPLGFPVRMIVIERKFQNCPAGVQVWYCCRMTNEEGVTNTADFNEVELCEYPPEQVALGANIFERLEGLENQQRQMRRQISEFQMTVASKDWKKPEA
jgi:hypothetical protein